MSAATGHPGATRATHAAELGDRSAHYVDGAWRAPLTNGRLHVIDPTTEARVGSAPSGGVADADRAVAAARRAFDG